jgi:hypothetical protein
VEWVKLYAVPAYYYDPALLRAGEQAEVLFCRGLAYCGGVESAGVIDKTVLPMLVPTKPQARADALVREGLWLDEGTHYRIRSWEKLQDEHDVAAEKRRKDRERQREHRRKAREDASRVDVPPVSRDMSRDSHAPNSDGHDVDVEGEVEKNTSSRKRDEPEGFAAFWMAYPRKIGKGAAVKAYAKALKDATPAQLLAAASEFARERAGQDEKFTPHPSTWLNAQRWEDETAAPMDKRAAWLAAHPHIDPADEYLIPESVFR